MADESRGTDLTGIGEVAKAIPEAGWRKAIDTACDTFSDLIAPVTKTTAGLGGLIQAKFDAMIDVQKVFAADVVQRARLKTQDLGHSQNPRPSARVLVQAIEEASIESDDNLRDIWANLIANEISGGDVHPEFPSTLSRLSAADALVLAEIAEKDEKTGTRALARQLSRTFGLSIGVTIVTNEGSDAQHEHLERLALIARREGLWKLTHFGESFVNAVTEPGLRLKKAK
jgi:hypothetical protein